MSSFDKIVKLACKPKAAPPKAKYLDPIIMATYSDDGSIHDVCKALSPRLREPNAVIVFKALIVLHTMIRNGATDNVLSYLSASDVLRLRNVTSGQWEGYDAPPNLIRYAAYLETRIRAYKDLKHDAIRVQSETNRDAHVTPESSNKRGGKPLERSKTVMGRKLRSLAVEKGLLRETKTVQKQMDALLTCKFYLDDLEDELTITALRLLVKDLMVLFQAVNEGVINVLEHYFEMSHVDAEEALKIYHVFCKQTEQVVEYLSVAKKMQNLLNVQIPNLKIAPVSLAGSLEEYLKDPNFEQNRLEYKANKDIADGKVPKREQTTKTEAKPSVPAASSGGTQASSTAQPPPAQAPTRAETNKDLVDFFASIEQGQTDMFNPQTESPTRVFANQQAVHNPFVQRQSMMMPQMPGAFPGAFPGAQGAFMQAQPTGFPMQQAGLFPSAPPMQPFLQPALTGFPQTAFIQPQPTQLLQPQATGANPFRQSMFAPHGAGLQGMGPLPTAPATAPMRSSSAFEPQAPAPQPQISAQATGFTSQPFRSQPPASAVPQRSASTPLTGPLTSAHTAASPLVPMKTGSRNPFAPAGEVVPPVPSMPPAPSLNAMRTGMMSSFHQPLRANTLPSVPEQPNASPPASTPGGDMSSIASAFTFDRSGGPSASGAASSANQTWMGSQPSVPTTSTPFSSTPFTTGIGASSNSQDRPALAPIQAQQTGFAGSSVKPFQPTSSFGASLLASLPPLSSPTTTSSSFTAGTPSSTSTATPSLSYSAVSSQRTGFPGPGSQPGGIGSNGQPAQNPQSGLSQPFGQGLGSQNGGLSGGLGGGLMPQPTGLANPFRASTFIPTNGQQLGQSPFGNGAFQPAAPSKSGPTPFGSQAPTGSPINFQPNNTPFGQAFGQPNQGQAGAFSSLI